MSSQSSGTEVDLAGVHGASPGDGGVDQGALLIAFTEAVMGDDALALERARQALRAALPGESFVDVAAVVAAFNVVDRIADATGIPLDPMVEAMSVEIRRELDLARFASAANTPGAS